MEDRFRYTDETDRCYGAAGMAIGLVIYDGDEMLASISLDSTPEGEMLALTPEFYFAGSPAVSARSAWNRMVRNYNIGVGMLIANLMCRSMVKDRKYLSDELHDFLHGLAREEGRDSCSLDDDEIDSIFNKSYTYLNRVFSHHGVQSVAHDFAAELARRRTLSRLDVLEQLSSLRML